MPPRALEVYDPTTTRGSAARPRRRDRGQPPAPHERRRAAAGIQVLHLDSASHDAFEIAAR